MADLAKISNPFKGCTACRRLEQLLKRYNRGEIARVEWLDHLTLNRIQQCRAQVPSATSFHDICQQSGMISLVLYASKWQACH